MGSKALLFASFHSWTVLPGRHSPWQQRPVILQVKSIAAATSRIPQTCSHCKQQAEPWPNLLPTTPGPKHEWLGNYAVTQHISFIQQSLHMVQSSARIPSRACRNQPFFNSPPRPQTVQCSYTTVAYSSAQYSAVVYSTSQYSRQKYSSVDCSPTQDSRVSHSPPLLTLQASAILQKSGKISSSFSGSPRNVCAWFA